MIENYGKRALSFFLAMIMIISAMPLQVFATDNHDHPEENIVTYSEISDEMLEEINAAASDQAIELADRMNAVLEVYGITADMTDDEIKQAINAQSWSVNKPIITEIAEILAVVETLSDIDAAYVLTHVDVETFYRFKDVFEPMFVVAMAAASGSHTPVTGVTVGVSGATDNSMSNGAITVTAKGSKGVLGIGASTKTATITVYNESGSKANISFDWTATSVNELKIDGTVYSGNSGKFEKVLEAGASFVITITTAKNSTENKLVMRNFACTPVKESSLVTFQYDSGMGSITVDGNAVEADSSMDIPSAGAVLNAVASNGATFLGWINAETHLLLSKDASFTLEPADDMTVKAVFTTDACFLVNGNALYEDLNAAITAVGAVANKTIILANNGTLPAGEYTIPSDVTLLVPFDAANTVCTTAPKTTESSYTAPTAYRTLTMAEGAHIVVNGALSLPATQAAGSGKSSPMGATSFIQMKSDSTITVNSGGNLYAWGFIQGSGAVTVKSGATVYECFQVMDWRGGDNTSGMIDNDYRVFPFSQYYVQNVEVPMTLEAGATEKGYMSIDISLVGIQEAAVPFIGSDGMFNIDSGYIVKDYEEETGRLKIDVYGALSIKSLSMSMKLGLLGTKTINSQDYVLPINGNMTITMQNGGSIHMTQDIALQPGAKLIVAEGATCTLGSGNSIYVYDYDEWITDADTGNNEGPSFCGAGDAAYVNLSYPTSAKTVVGRDQDAYVEINGTADLSAGFVYTTAGGAQITGTGTIIMQPGKSDAKTYQIKDIGSDNKDDKWFEIPITSAKLMNADGTYTETAGLTGAVSFQKVDGVWTIVHDYVAVVTAPTCTEGGFTTYTCKNCGASYIDEAVEALGHDEVSHEGQAPTCSAVGWEAYVTCSRCDYTTYVEIAPVAHNEVNHEGRAATCTEIGWNAYVTCADCDYTTYAEIAALGHNYEAVVTAPTCTEAGFTTHTCSNCGDSYTDSETEATGHVWEWVTDQEATTEEPGIKHEECSVCHAKQNENTEIPVLKCEHVGTLTIIEAKAETCTEDGNTRYSYCSACENYFSDDAGQHEIEKDSWIIPALGHDETAYEAQAVTCTEIGWEAYVTCSRCDYTTYVEIPALGHDETEHEAKPATCQEAGWEAYVDCSRCDYTTKVDLPVNPDGHVWNEGEPYKIHSCNSASYIVYTCTLCGTKNQVVDREQHFRIPIGEEIPATCTEDGMTSGWKCEKCDEFWIPQEVIPALGHDWNNVYPCQNDSAACTRCDTYFDTKQDHLAIIDPAIPATCTETGLTEGSHCGFCKEVLVAQTVAPVTDHNWFVADMEIPATCDTNGHKEGAKYCMDCNYDADPIPALDHSWMHRDAKKATYSAIGWTAHDYCLVCKTIKSLDQYENDPCEYCGDHPEGYTEIPKVEVQRNATLDEFLTNLGYLEAMAEQYALENPSADPLGLVLNYMRTAVANYTTGSWAIMAGAEDKAFLKYVQDAEDAINSNPEIDVWVNVSGLKKLEAYPNTHGETNLYTNKTLPILGGHFFGTMDMTYHNKGSQNHADVGGWVGDLTDLLSTSDEFGVDPSLTLEEKVAYIRNNYLFSNKVAGSAGAFGGNDLYADLEAYYIMNELITKGYKTGDLEKMLREYFQPGLTLKQRVSYLLTNRLDGLSTRKDLRTAVYNAYTSNKLIATLEGTRTFNATGNDLAELRKAVCYAFADEMCRIAGDYVEDLTNPRFTVFDTDTKILAPGVSQQINYATNADGNQIVYYVATADVLRDDVGLWVNYYDRDPGTPENPEWKNNSVPSSAQNAQDRYGDPASEDYIENFNVIASTNAGGYDMSDVATPGGLMVMNGIEWHPQSGTAGFFAILDDGSAYMGTAAEYATMKDRIQEAIGGFGEFVVQNGEVTGSSTKSDAPRTSVGITATGRVVLMCIDGRQAPFSSGASLEDVGYIMKEAGCVVAINLDGGGSTTFVARQPGSDELTVMNRPSDGYPRNVSTNLLIYSTAPSSTAFDHAVVESEYDYATIGTAVQMTAAGVSPAGNAVDVPEGATWAVSDENWASITEDGVFTGKRLGEVTVYLMLDDQVIGSKLMTLTNPDQLYFERAKVDVIYGSSVALPLRARTGGKPIAINPNDVTITLSAPAAGSMNGFTFNAVESAVKSMSITASINENITASINVMLYEQGENSFDFDKATGGDRQLAWDRQVTNAKVEDGSIYNVIDPNKDMVTSYIFALDMTSIPIPERLEELTYMLPGGTVEGSNAWTFLTSLAQRISDLSWVQATIDFDDRFDVDYSELNILNDYFEMKEVKFDETTNSLTVTMHWIKQSQVIDEATANPLCLIKGIKLTPKAGVWEDATKINAVTSGTIGYEIYMRASGLYSFAQKPENQAVFGVYPYRNPADTNDAGGYFRDTYAQITDEYTLVNVLKEGWVNEEGGFAYYVEGERLTGVQKVDGYYYDFGENGVNVGQEKYSGLLNENGKMYCVRLGEFTYGWHEIDTNWYYFDKTSFRGLNGIISFVINGVTIEYEFENGLLLDGVWYDDGVGMRYYYGPGSYFRGWKEIDGATYYFENYYRLENISPILSSGSLYKIWYEFTEDGKLIGPAPDGIYWYEGELYYVVDQGSRLAGLYQVGSDYYYIKSDFTAVRGTTYWVGTTNGLLSAGTYRFAEDGKMIMTTEVVNEDGTWYYYKDGKRTANAGLILLDGNYYHIESGAIASANKTVWVENTNGLKPKGTYEFDAEAKMVIKQGIVDGYYYVDGEKTGGGLIMIEGSYYYVESNGKVIMNKSHWVGTTNGLLSAGTYRFAEDGKMIMTTEVVNEDGTWYYYKDGKRTANAGLILLDGNYYHIESGAIASANKTVWVENTNGLMEKGSYTFDANAKMILN